MTKNNSHDHHAGARRPVPRAAAGPACACACDCGARDATPAAPGGVARGGPPAEPPFGVPVLAEVPELTGLLEDLRAIDRLVARVIDALLLVEDTSLAEAATGLPVERWIAAIAGRTRSDRRMLQTATQACRRLPSIHAAFRAGRLSWAQLRVVALRLERLPRDLDDRIDAELARALDAVGPHPDPDSLTGVVSQVLAAWEPTAREVAGPGAGAPDVDFLAMQPRLDGSGGTLYGDFGPAGFAAIDNRLAPAAPDSGGRDSFGADPAPEDAGATGKQLARSRAEKLIELCTTRAGDDEGGRAPVPASYVVRLDVETLLRLAPDRAGRLLTTLTGGAMWIDADTARTLADAHGASLRLVLHQQGRVVGVGRRTEKVPGWLAEATLAIHETCTAPGCRVAARVCDTDHAQPVSARGRTDIDNLAPLCATDNRAKEPDGWRAVQAADGRRRWHHPRSGLVTDTLPATWRPPGDGQDDAPPGPGDDRPPDDPGRDRAAPDESEGRGPPDRAPPPIQASDPHDHPHDDPQV